MLNRVLTNRSSRPFLVAQILTCSLLWGCGDSGSSSAPPIPRVRVFEVGEKTAGQVRSFSGEVAADESSPLSFGVAGTIQSISVKEGDLVEQGQVLAALEARPLRLDADRARAELGGARAKLVEAEQTYERVAKLLPMRAASQAEVETALAAVRSARASLEAKQSEVERAERDLDRSTLRAPFDGRIAEKSAKPFQEIGSNEAALVIQSGRALVVRVLVPETLIRFVEYGDAADVRFPGAGPDSGVVGLVSLIGAQAGEGNGFSVEIRLPEDAAETVRAGMTATVTFSFDDYLEGRTAFLVPISVLALDEGLARDPDLASMTVPVFVADESAGRLTLRQVRVGGVRGNQLEVFEGLDEGEKVVTAGVPFLRDGMEVEIWDREKGIR